MTRAVVSVITGAYNCSEYIAEAYDSLRRQTFSDWEWVVVDDASTDDTLGILNGIAQNDARVRVLANNKNLDRIEVGVTAQAFVDLAAEQLVDRLAELLADDVPAGYLDAAQHADQGQVGAQSKAAAIDPAPQGLDLEGVGAEDVARADVLDHR